MSELNLDQKRELLRQMGPAVHQNVHRFAIAMFDLASGNLSSGTLVGIGGHVFVITAGHVIPASPNGRLILLGATPRKLGGPAPGILKHAAVDVDGIDVGFLELDPTNVASLLGKDTLPIDRVTDLGAGNPKMFSVTTGCPGEKTPDPVKEGKLVPQFWAVAAIPISPAEYSKLEPLPLNAQPANADVDVFLDYEEGDSRRLDTYDRISFPAVPGMSGGAYFDWGYAATGIWSPNCARVFGIQSSWCKEHKQTYARGTQIIHWLRLVREHYPDLSSLLAGRFPRLNTL